MKKFVIIIGVLLIIFLGMFFYRKSERQAREVTVSDVENIEKYVNELYKWKEITGEALPTFDNVNNAPDKWVWEVVKNYLEDYELTYEQIKERS